MTTHCGSRISSAFAQFAIVIRRGGFGNVRCSATSIVAHAGVSREANQSETFDKSPPKDTLSHHSQVLESSPQSHVRSLYMRLYNRPQLLPSPTPLPSHPRTEVTQYFRPAKSNSHPSVYSATRRYQSRCTNRRKRKVRAAESRPRHAADVHMRDLALAGLDGACRWEAARGYRTLFRSFR